MHVKKYVDNKFLVFFPFYMTGMLQSTDIGLKISMTPMRDFYIFKLECFSCWRPYGDHVEFYVNDVSIDELRKYDGMCFHTQIRCNPKICRCCDDSNIYIIEHRTNDLTNIRFFSCHMRFKDIFTTEMKRQNVSIPFNRQCKYICSIFYPLIGVLTCMTIAMNYSYNAVNVYTSR